MPSRRRFLSQLLAVSDFFTLDLGLPVLCNGAVNVVDDVLNRSLGTCGLAICHGVRVNSDRDSSTVSSANSVINIGPKLSHLSAIGHILHRGDDVQFEKVTVWL